MNIPPADDLEGLDFPDLGELELPDLDLDHLPAIPSLDDLETEPLLASEDWQSLLAEDPGLDSLPAGDDLA